MDDIIARRKLKASAGKRKHDEIDEDESEDEGDDGKEQEGLSDSSTNEDEDTDDPMLTSDEDDGSDTSVDERDDRLSDEGSNDEALDSDSDEGSSEEETQAERDRKAAYFDNDPSSSSGPVHTSFSSMNLSRPILRALTSVSFTSPTPIQAATIPVALLGKDVVGNAVTGSGKTAAFMIPVLERLLYREKGKNAAAVRCVVLVPTRELGVQCFEVAKKLATHTDIRFSLIVGTCTYNGIRFRVN